MQNPSYQRTYNTKYITVKESVTSRPFQHYKCKTTTKYFCDQNYSPL